jgi:hypothetical protein
MHRRIEQRIDVLFPLQRAKFGTVDAGNPLKARLRGMFFEPSVGGFDAHF